METYDQLIERKAAELGIELNDSVREMVRAYLEATRGKEAST